MITTMMDYYLVPDHALPTIHYRLKLRSGRDMDQVQSANPQGRPRATA